MKFFERSVRRARIAYFSMEIALRPEVHTYSGGLGVLAGDTARSAADLDLPMVFVTLLSRQGYVRQAMTPRGEQESGPNPWSPADWAKPLPGMVAVKIEGRDVWIRPWLYAAKCPLGHAIPVLLLDTDLQENEPADRGITDFLYGGDDAYRLKQEIVLGIGGRLILRALGFKIDKFHLNEGHAALLTLPLLREASLRHADPSQPLLRYDIGAVRDRCVFTTHTPVEAGFDKFDYELVRTVLGDYIELEALKALAGPARLNMTQLALNLSSYVNGVARRHAETSRQMFPGYEITSITNGVHVHTWTHRAIGDLHTSRYPNWAHEPETLAFADQLDDASVWNAHQEAKAELLAIISEETGAQLRDDVPLIGYARRMTAYKRPELVFSDIERLSAIAQKHPFQIVLAGLAHPRDEGGAKAIAAFRRHIERLDGIAQVVFLPGYDMRLSAALVAGCDIWLNTPLAPLEASGTSGMKAALNGVLNLSVLDGWWLEGCVDGVTGWSIEGTPPGSGDGSALYSKLEDVVLPLYYRDRAGWVWMMKQAISKIGPLFNSHRMMSRYVTEAYAR